MGAKSSQPAHADAAKDSHKHDDQVEMPQSSETKHEVAILVEPSRDAEEKGRVRTKQKGGGDIEKGVQEEEEEGEEKLHSAAVAASPEPPRAAILIFFAVGLFSLVWVLLMLPPLTSVQDGDKFVYRPTTARELEFDKNLLLRYRNEHSGRLFLGMASVYILCQTFCIPGSGTTLNLLAGAMTSEYMPYAEFFIALPFCIFCAAAGALMCWALSFLTARDLVTRSFPEKVRWLRKLVSDNRSSAPILFISLRMSPIVPAYFLNIAAPLTPLPPLHFFLATLVGASPHAFVTVSTGATLSRLEPGESLVQRNLGQIAIMLLLAILVCFLPTLTKRFHNRIVGHT